MAIYARGGPLIEDGVEADVKDGISVDAVLRLFDNFAASDVIDARASIL